MSFFLKEATDVALHTLLVSSFPVFGASKAKPWSNGMKSGKEELPGIFNG